VKHHLVEFLAPLVGCPVAAPAGDDDQVRARLLRAGLGLFSAQGFAKTSIRQIASAAHANVAAVSYYFGDKAGLYRSLLQGAPGLTRNPSSILTDPAPEQLSSPGSNGLASYYSGFLEPLKSGEAARMWVKLYRREMLEPTGLWQEQLDQHLKPMQKALVDLLCQRLGLAAPDEDVERLAIVVAGLVVHVFVSCDVIDELAPHLVASAKAIDIWAERLLFYADALIEAELGRRRLAPAEAAVESTVLTSGAHRTSPRTSPNSAGKTT
jgi:AcrR family transcriptional regulator